MKTMSQTSALNPSVLILAALAAVIVFVPLRGSALPLLSNLKVNLAILLVLGMAICAQGGIGRVAAAGQWAHPLAILAYFIGAAILILAAAVFFNVKLPLITSQQQAFVFIVALMGAKIIDSVSHSLLSHS
jgi:hypothetical protein